MKKELKSKVKLDRANKSILLRALGDVYYGQRARGGSAEETGRLILRVNNLPAGGKLTMSAAEYRLAKAALNQLRTQRLAEGGYTDAVDDALTRLLHAHTPLLLWRMACSYRGDNVKGLQFAKQWQEIMKSSC